MPSRTASSSFSRCGWVIVQAQRFFDLLHAPVAGWLVVPVFRMAEGIGQQPSVPSVRRYFYIADSLTQDMLQWSPDKVRAIVEICPADTGVERGVAQQVDILPAYMLLYLEAAYGPAVFVYRISHRGAGGVFSFHIPRFEFFLFAYDQIFKVGQGATHGHQVGDQ